MNLAKLFEMQRELDERIIEKKGLQGQDLLPNTILALYAELGELLNEWRGFKHWSDDREPVRKKYRCTCGNEYKENIDCHECSYTGTYFSIEEYDPLLEEYVDCLHFILSIGLQLGYYPPSLRLTFPTTGGRNNESTVEMFNDCFKLAVFILEYDYYETLFQYFIYLGYLLGFTWEQIEQAYIEKNAINHERQNNGY